MKKRPIKTHPMWNPNEPTYADVGADLSPELIEALVRDILRQHLDALIPAIAREITQRLR